MQAVVLAGGKGSRLSKDPNAPPKPLLSLGGLSLLEHDLLRLAERGVTDVILCTGYRAEMIEAAIGDGSRLGLRVRHSIERTPLGTAGAVRACAEWLEDRFVVAYGDVLTDVDVARLVIAHQRSKALATLAAHPNDHPFDSDRIVADRHGYVQRLVRKEDVAGPEAGALCNAALYVVEKRLVMDYVPNDDVMRDFARDVFPEVVRRGEKLWAYRTYEYLKDVGTPERRELVTSHLAQGVPASMRLSSPRPAMLLDRDGVLIEDEPYITKPEQLALIDGAAPALGRLNREHVLALVCTNQPVVARGELDEDGLHAIHRHLEGLFGKEGVWLDELFVCPHHPDGGFAGERVDLKHACPCRKPAPGLIEQAAAAVSLDRGASVFVGDRTADLVAAAAAGVLGVGVRTGAGCRDGKHPIAPETPIVAHLGEAVALMLDTAPSWSPWLAPVRQAGIVTLGGPSRSGKTVAAAALSLALARDGVRTLHVSLDRFIQPASERRDGSTVLERTGWGEAKAALHALVNGDAVVFPGYEPFTRKRAASRVVQWDHRAVLVVEGLLANDLELPNALEIAVVADRDVLRTRRASFYAWKGLAGAALAEAVDGREEELATVAHAIARAKLRLTLDPNHRLQETT